MFVSRRCFSFRTLVILLCSIACFTAYLMYAGHTKYDNGRSLLESNVKLFLKQIARARRFERNDQLRERMNEVIDGISTRHEETAIRNIQFKDITIVFNAIHEIRDIESFLISSRNRFNNEQWLKSINIIVGLTKDQHRRYRRLRNLKDEFLNLQLLRFSSNVVDALTESLSYIVRNVQTKYVVISRSIRKLDFSEDTISRLVAPLQDQSSDVVAGTVVNGEGTWSMGCYQTKLLWHQYKAEHGHDFTGNENYTMCDSMDGPFATRTELLLNHLSDDSLPSVQNDDDILMSYFSGKPAVRLPDSLVYIDLFYAMAQKRKIMKVCLHCLFSMVDESRDNWESSRTKWSSFAEKNSISEILTPTKAVASEISGSSTHVFSCEEVRIPCNRKQKGMLVERCCYHELHRMLMAIFKIFDTYGMQYTNNDGSGLGGIKVSNTLPWDLDHDFDFRSNNFTNLVDHEKEFNSEGMTVHQELDDPCLKDPMGRWTCGYVGLKSMGWYKRIWRIEAWGQYLLLNDFYERDLVSKERIDKHPDFFVKSRIIGNSTLVPMREHWSKNRPNPGQFTRACFGLDALKHVQHWMVGGKNAKGEWEVSSFRHFEACLKPGSHFCMNQFLSDGNIQFKRVWT